MAQLATAQPAVCALRNASGHTPFGLAVQHRSARNGLQAAEHLIAFGPAADLVSALAAADEEEVAARLVPQLVARWRLTALEWGLLPASVPGLWRVLPAVLERSAEEAAALVLHMMAEEREQMWTAALCLARLQRCQGRELPPDVLATILALGHD